MSVTRRLHLSSISAVALVAATPAVAQETAPPQSDTRASVDTEIVVTAQRREERLSEVPVPVTALRAEALLETNQTRLQDYFTSVPGLNVSPAPGAGGQQTLVIRGITTGAFTNPTVGVTVDGVPFGAATTALGNVVPDIDPSDLARIEVLRGPQGALYGASSMGGLVQFVTLTPSFDRVSGRIHGGLSGVSGGSDPGYTVHGSVNLPVTEQFAVRASGFSRQTPGFIDNVRLGRRDVNEERAIGGLLSAFIKPSDAVSLRLSALYQDLDGDGAQQVIVAPGLDDLEQNYVAGAGTFERTVQAYSATLTADLDVAELTSITGYNINRFSNTTDQTGSSGAAARTFFNVDGAILAIDRGETRKFTQELRASIPLGTSIDWLVGGFYTRERTNVPQYIAGVDPSSGVVAGRLFDTVIRYRYREYAAFTNLTFRITDRFDVQLGGRQSWIDFNRLAQTTSGAQFPTPSQAATQFSSADSFTYLLTPRFRVSPDLLIYARFASGFRPGGPNNALCSSFNSFPCQFSPDETRSYEVGIRGNTPDRVLSFDASVYYIDWRDIQINLRDPVSTFNYTTNGSRAKSEGGELSLTLRPVAGLTLTGWGAYSNAVLTEDFPVGSTAFGRDGNRLPFASRWSGSLAADYRFPVGALEGSIGGSVNYVGDRVGTFIATPARQVYPDYTRVDLRAGLSYDDWALNLYVTNVTNSRGLIGGGTGTFPGNAFVQIQPRTFGFSVSRNF